MLIILLFAVLSILFITLYILIIPTKLILIPLLALLGIVSAILVITLYIFFIYIICPYSNPKSKFKQALLYPIVDFARIMCNVKYKVIGKENIPSNTFVGFPNHKSYFDIVLLYLALNKPLGAAGKKELFKNKIFKRLGNAIGCITIDRDNDRESIKNIIKATKIIESGLNYIIFPEGGRKSLDTDLMVDLKPGAYKLATKPKADILPISLIGNSSMTKKKILERKKVTVIIHNPIKYEEYKDYNTQELGLLVGTIVNEGIKNGTPNKKPLKDIEIVPFIQENEE